MTLEITTKIGCSNNCSYCPQDKLLKNYVGNLFMTTSQFKQILDNTPTNVQIDFAGFCEPFLNPWASWMIKYASEKGYDIVLDTTLTGFSENEANGLKGVHFKQVYVHKFNDVPKEKIELLRNMVITDRFEIGNLETKHIYSRAGNLWDTETKKGRFECGWNNDFTRNVVLPNGDVYLCCMDYSLKHKIGNMFTTHYNNLNRNEIKELSGKKLSDCICRKCEICKIV
jgi:radical SAM protein with 4Fe4S-binding SPASM domain